MSETARDLQARLDALITDARAALAEVATLTRLSAADPAVLGEVGQHLAAARTEAAELRALLAAADLGAEAAPQRADLVMAAWRWSRELMASLVRLDAGLALAGEALANVTPLTRRRVTVRQGDTLQSVAQRELGDHRRWRELASLNNLAPGAPTPGSLWVPA